jgi:hypothetical protein
MGSALAVDITPASDAAPRLVCPGAEEVLERFIDPALLGAGKVNLISLEAVEKRLGARSHRRAAALASLGATHMSLVAD